MKLIVGLGNPGDKYTNTRHNTGFIYINELANKWDCGFKFESKFKAEIAKTEKFGESILLAKPQTYMNLSGEAVRALLNFYKIDTEDIFIVYDDIAMPAGALRFRATGSDGGHNGIKSIIQNTGTQKFDRLKIGIGPQPTGMPSENFVLGKFTKDQIEPLTKAINSAMDATEEYLINGLNSAQCKYNCKG
ncbi:MAG: aminoacyl-tRNA hydrolase [Candidatus Gastranaerophilales bacterium]|nr:aminoacyl-tRNA hydrolase [Candidatus Gastranaerophilales bacterium]